MFLDPTLTCRLIIKKKHKHTKSISENEYFVMKKKKNRNLDIIALNHMYDMRLFCVIVKQSYQIRTEQKTKPNQNKKNHNTIIHNAWNLADVCCW